MATLSALTWCYAINRRANHSYIYYERWVSLSRSKTVPPLSYAGKLTLKTDATKLMPYSKTTLSGRSIATVPRISAWRLYAVCAS